MLPSYNACQRTIQRKRKYTLEPHQTPRTVADIVVSNAQQMILRGSPFLLWDSGALDPHRILMFGTNDTCEPVAKSSTLVY
jgi:hypothetical protein